MIITTNMKTISYHLAKKDGSLRQDFLNQFLREYPKKAVTKLIYGFDKFKKFLDNELKKGSFDKKEYNKIIKSSKEHEGTDVHLLAFCARGDLGMGKRKPIFVMPDCFRLKYEDFIAVLADHEYIHAEHVNSGIKFKEGLELNYLNFQSFNPPVVLDLDESVAYCYTLLNAIEKKNFSEFIEGCAESLEEFTKSLRNRGKFKSTAEESTIKFQIKKNNEVLKRYSMKK